VAPSLDGVTYVTAVADLVVHRWMGRGKLSPSLRPGLCALGPRVIGTIVEGVITVSPYWQGVHVGVAPVDGGRCLG
jgi:hypothetical protein